MAGEISKWYDTVENTGILDPAGLFSQPKNQWLGGSRAAFDEIQNRYKAGQGSGQGLIDSGVGTVDRGVGLAGDSYGSASQYADQGRQLGLAGIAQQDRDLARQDSWGRSMLDTARGTDSSYAQTLLQSGLDQAARGMYGQAASARGGNQAAAMQAAQGNASMLALQGAQQSAMLRAQEEQQKRANIMAAQGALAGYAGNRANVGGQRTALGYGVQGQGIGLGLGASGQMIGAGGTVAGIGSGQQGNYLSAEQRANEAQLQASTQGQEAKSRYKGGILSGISSAFSLGG